MRLFVAVNLPAAIKERIAQVIDEMRDASLPVRWVDEDSIHLTLKFLGEVAEQSKDDIARALAHAAEGVPTFDVVVRGFGAFPSRTRPRVFWLGVEAPPPLYELQRQVEAGIAPLGYATEKRAFSPHLTIGRVKENARLERASAERIAPSGEFSAAFTVASADLMRSHLSSRGARYEILERAPLRGARETGTLA